MPKSNYKPTAFNNIKLYLLGALLYKNVNCPISTCGDVNLNTVVVKRFYKNSYYMHASDAVKTKISTEISGCSTNLMSYNELFWGITEQLSEIIKDFRKANDSLEPKQLFAQIFKKISQDDLKKQVGVRIAKLLVRDENFVSQFYDKVANSLPAVSWQPATPSTSEGSLSPRASSTGSPSSTGASPTFDALASPLPSPLPRISAPNSPLPSNIAGRSTFASIYLPSAPGEAPTFNALPAGMPQSPQYVSASQFAGISGGSPTTPPFGLPYNTFSPTGAKTNIGSPPPRTTTVTSPAQTMSSPFAGATANYALAHSASWILHLSPAGLLCSSHHSVRLPALHLE